METYKAQFRPSEQFPEPHAILSISVLCAETEEKARVLRKLSDYVLLQFERGHFEPMCSPEEIQDYEFSPAEQERIRYNNGRIISGTPAQVKQQLTDLANEFNVDEVVVASMTYSQEDRVKGFELLAKEFGLEGA